MKTSQFVAAIEAAFQRAYQDTAAISTVPYVDRTDGESKFCLGLLLSKGEQFAVVVANAAHWIASDPDNIFDHGSDVHGITELGGALDVLEDFHNLVAGMLVAPYMQWTCVYFPGLTQEQIDAEKDIDPVDGSFVPNPQGN